MSSSSGRCRESSAFLGLFTLFRPSVDDMMSHCRGPPTSVSPPIQMLICSRNNLTDMPSSNLTRDLVSPGREVDTKWSITRPVGQCG